MEIAGLGKTFPSGGPALENFSLTVEPGEFVSFVGPSGCGKTTLLRLVSGLLAPSTGRVLVDGRPPAAARGRMSFVFQNATLLPWRTAAGNVALGLELAGVPPKERAPMIAERLALVGLTHAGDRYPHELSGGMQMRVSIARALATRPRLLLMADPFGARDEISRDRLNEELLRLRAVGGWTTLYVTHSVAEAVFLSDRIVVLGSRPGRMVGEVKVPLPHPREESVRGGEEFLRTVRKVVRTLRDHGEGAPE